MVESAEAVVQRQFETYNAHDLEGFMDTFADDVDMRLLPDNELFLSGSDAVRHYYQHHRFNLPDLQAQLLHRMVAGDTVIDHERLIGLEPHRTVEAMAIYRVVEGRIQNVWFIRACNPIP